MTTAAMINPALVLLTPKEMAQADEMAVELGADSYDLMRRAAQAVADAVTARFAPATRIAILAGRGNNGGDALYAGHLLRRAGWMVDLFMPGPPLSADAQRALGDLAGEWAPLDAFDPAAYGLVIDGLLGAGLTRDVAGVEAAALRRLAESARPVLAIDLPSGVSGATGEVRGVAAPAAVTVTFFRRKPGHLLEPGAGLCGEIMVADIGIPDGVIAAIGPQAFDNQPALWAASLLRPGDSQHKYTRGHAAVFSGGFSQTGAARLSAMAALRGGAGLVTLLSPGSALAVNAAHLTAIMLTRCDDEAALAALLADTRLKAFVLGPGFGVGQPARAYAAQILGADRALVLDADGISSFATHSADLFHLAAASAGQLVMTPHSGEFARLFPEIAHDSVLGKLEQARAAARLSHGVVVLKGSDTVIAAPDGRAAINRTGTPALATAGSGDVLTGLIAAQLANGVPAFEAAAAAAWLHGVAARLYGPGLIAEDLPELVPGALGALYSLCGFGLPGWPA